MPDWPASARSAREDASLAPVSSGRGVEAPDVPGTTPPRRSPVSHVAIVTDSASDMDPARAAERGITIVPLEVTFGSESFKAGVDLSTEEFWQRMTAPDAPFPKTAASSPGEFKAVYDAAFASGADAVVSIPVPGTPSGPTPNAAVA